MMAAVVISPSLEHIYSTLITSTEGLNYLGEWESPKPSDST